MPSWWYVKWQELRWRDFVTWPRRDGGGPSDGSSGDEPADAPRALKRHNRASRLKDWQEDRKWVLRVRYSKGRASRMPRVPTSRQ